MATFRTEMENTSASYLHQPQIMTRKLFHSSISISPGVANALDLTDRLLPRLLSHGCQPSTVHFPPYTHPQITAIIVDRLRQFGMESAIQPMALSLCARKVAANNGDLRAALDICR